MAFAVLAVSACGPRESSTVESAAPETTTPALETAPQAVVALAIEAPEDVAFWSEFAVDANWVETYPTVRETVDAVDLAVIANVRAVVPTEPIGGDAPGGEITIVHLEMEVVTDISGSGLKEFTLQLEGGPLDREQYAAWVDELATQLPTGSAFALRMTNVGYIINSWSIWVMTEEGLVAPLDPHFEQNRSYFEDELSGLTTYEELTRYLDKSTE
ncbi:MAG: hypothetical protein WCC60_08415 [Ilumatobacteraceae bacterium]